MAQFKTEFKKALLIGSNRTMCEKWPPHRSRPTPPRMKNVPGITDTQRELMYTAMFFGFVFNRRAQRV